MQVIVDKHTVTIVKNEIVNEGEYNVQSCNFQFSSDYDGLPKIAIFKTGTVTKQIMLSGNTCITPDEVLQTTGIVGLGVYAYQTDGDNLTLRYSPTPAVFTVEPGSYDEGDAPTPPTPSVIEQLQEEITQNANNITSLENVTDTHTTQIGTLQTDVNNIKTEQITQNTNIQTNANDISNIKTEQITQNNNIQANADDITTLQTSLSNETTNRENADINLQQQIDAITSSSDIVDIVGTYAQLQAYDTQHLSNNDVIKVLQDETHENAMTYYRWDKHNSQWIYIGQEAPYYTKSETDTLLQGKANVNDVYTKNQIDDTLEDYALKTDLTDFITEQEVDTKLEDYVDTTTYTQGQATQDANIEENASNIDWLQTLVNQMPTVSGQGTDLSLESVLNYRLMKFLPQGVSSQDGEPTPTTPIPVNNVTGDNSLVLQNENLFDKNNTDSGYIDATGNFVSNASWTSTNDYIQVLPNSDYVLKLSATKRILICEYDKNYLLIGNRIDTNSSSYSLTTSNNTKYVKFSVYTQVDTPTIMFIKGSTTPSTYVEHEEQNYPIYLGGNVFELSKVTENAYINNNGTIGTSSASNLSGYTPVIGGLTYNLTYDYETLLNQGSRGYCFYDSNQNYLSGALYSPIDKTRQITIPINARYFRFAYDKNCTNISLATDMTPIELNSSPDGTIRDAIIGTPDNWVKREYIGKIVLNGSESGWNYAENDKVFYNNSVLSNKYLSQSAYSNYFTNIIDNRINNNYYAGLYLQNGQFSFRVGTKDRIYIKYTDITTIEDFKTWLSIHNTIVYYRLAQYVDIPITDTTLINQLNNIYNNAHSYNGVTNITTTYEDGNEQMYLDIELLKNVWEVTE